MAWPATCGKKASKPAHVAAGGWMTTGSGGNLETVRSLLPGTHAAMLVLPIPGIAWHESEAHPGGRWPPVHTCLHAHMHARASFKALAHVVAAQMAADMPDVDAEGGAGDQGMGSASKALQQMRLNTPSGARSRCVQRTAVPGKDRDRRKHGPAQRRCLASRMTGPPYGPCRHCRALHAYHTRTTAWHC